MKRLNQLHLRQVTPSVCQFKCQIERIPCVFVKELNYEYHYNLVTYF